MRRYAETPQGKDLLDHVFSAVHNESVKLGERAAVEGTRGSLEASPTGHAVAAKRDDDQGPAAAQVCPHHNMHNSLPRRTG